MTPKVKICGIRTEAALDAAIEAGADFIGLVHFPRSPRHVELAAAAALSRRAHERSRTKVVVLLVDPEDAFVDAVVKEAAPDLLQLHGHESLERVRALRRRSGLAIIKAVGVGTPNEVSAAMDYLAPGEAAEFVLLDAKPLPGAGVLPGGNGLAFDWHILEAIKDRHALALAGGLTPDNVANAIRLTGAAIVDVSSGVESAPGEKSPELIRRFIRAAKAIKG
jgi:phosphoribosylanthranilate isomerase